MAGPKLKQRKRRPIEDDESEVATKPVLRSQRRLTVHPKPLGSLSSKGDQIADLPAG